MLKYIFPLILFFCNGLIPTNAQLVTKKDYSAAIALQAGAEGALMLSMKSAHFRITPTAGVKMTFPLNRKWFLGTEINYSQLKIAGKEKKLKLDIDQKKISVPVYLKYMLQSNRASVLLGAYVAYQLDTDITFKRPDELALAIPEPMFYDADRWTYGIVAGYEQQLAKRLNLTLKISCSVKTIGESQAISKKQIPLQAGLTLSYDIFRIGDCGCN